MNNPPEEKQCGDCSLCCKLMAIPELGKPKGVWCDHAIKKRGCIIHETRPGTCSAFHCLWLADPRLPPEWKPSRSRFVMAGTQAGEIVVHGDPDFPGAWRDARYLPGLRAMARAGQDRDGLVVIVERGHSTVLLADREVPLGMLKDDERLVSGRIATPDGPRLEVKVMKVDDAERLTGNARELRQRKSPL